MNGKATMAVAFAAGLVAGWTTTPPRYEFRGKVVLITGGSRGLGLILAKELAGEGAKIAILARDARELEQATAEIGAAGAEAFALVCDVRNQQQVESACRSVLEQFGRLDVLINNAGVIQVGPMENMTMRDYEEAMAVHFWGPLYMIKAVLPHMRKHRRGRIVNIASIGGEVGLPHMAPYCASKYALVGLSDSLRAELRPQGIHVTTVCPWMMRTGSYPNAILKGRQSAEDAWFSTSDRMPVVSIQARSAARRIIEACRYGQARLTLGWQGTLAVFFNAVAPGWVAFGQSMAAWIMPGPTAGGEQGRPWREMRAVHVP